MCIDSPRGSPEPPVCLSPPSSPDKEAGGPSRLLKQPENEPVPFLPSQVSLLSSFAYVHRMLPPFNWSACLFILKASGRWECALGLEGKGHVWNHKKETGFGIFGSFLKPHSSLYCCFVLISGSQNSVGRFVPHFAKLRKTVTRQAATREEDLGSGAFSSVRP